MVPTTSASESRPAWTEPLQSRRSQAYDSAVLKRQLRSAISSEVRAESATEGVSDEDIVVALAAPTVSRHRESRDH
jgi:hypothetical protein